MRTTVAKFLRDTWTLTWPYFKSEERWSARGLLAVIVGFNLGQVYLSVQFNEWYNLFYNALQERNEAEFYHQLLRFLVLAFLFIALIVYRIYLNQMLEIRWRRWLTTAFLDHWMARRAYYHMQLVDRGTDNPDQRIAEDLRMFVGQTIGYTLSLLREVVTLVSFMTILWGLSKDMQFFVWGVDVAFPGFMMWAAVLYAVIGTWLTHLVGRRLVRLNFDQQRFEADFRFSLIRFRENAEGIALYGGEAGEKRGLVERFGNVLANFWAIMKRQKLLNMLTSTYGQLAVIFPYVVAAPRYFADPNAQIGILLQTGNAFGQVQGALSWFVDAYAGLTEWKATVDRINGFAAAIERAATRPSDIVVAQDAAGALRLEDVGVALPDGSTLLRHADATVAPGEAVLVRGPSGSGKSTLFRAIAGIWPYGGGTVHWPRDARVLFLPQRPYLPIGTLRAVICYPAAEGAVGDAELRAVMEACGLGAFTDKLDEAHNWSLRLSQGEQQRIAFARALVIKPDWLFLDEASSALDQATEDRVYRLIRERLPATTVVSIGHRASLEQYHDRALEVRPAPDGGALVTSGP
ncbi:MAG: ABC transporter ATP-binding protein/permease [Alphaproteobacteria bacterium]|nr:ABC transporter ATP-binding protein/permease [Alphaproteobacteria bacterium]